MRIDPRLMIEFAAVAEEASFAKAATRLRIAQPWLSARIRRLEKLLGYPLLTRTTRRVTLTAEGSEFLAAARTVADATEAAGALALRLQHQKRQLLRVGVPPYSKRISERRKTIEAFVSIHPNVSLELEPGWSLALLERLRQGDVELTFLMGTFDAAEFEGLTLRSFGISLTMAPTHPLAHLTSIRPGDLSGRRMQVFTRGLNPGLWDELYKPFEDVQLRYVEAPEMAEGAPDEMADDEMVAAFFDFEEDAPAISDVVRIPLDAPKGVPFSLLRRRGSPSAAGQAFWLAAQRSLTKP